MVTHGKLLPFCGLPPSTPGYSTAITHPGHYPLPLQTLKTSFPASEHPTCHPGCHIPLYQHPHEEGTRACEEILNTWPSQDPPTKELCHLIHTILSIIASRSVDPTTYNYRVQLWVHAWPLPMQKFSWANLSKISSPLNPCNP